MKTTSRTEEKAGEAVEMGCDREVTAGQAGGGGRGVDGDEPCVL